MNFQDLEKALINRGYCEEAALNRIKGSIGNKNEKLIPTLVQDKILLEAEACYYAYGCEEFEIEGHLIRQAREKKIPDREIRDLFRDYILSGKIHDMRFEEFLICGKKFSEDEIYQILAEKYNIPFIYLSPEKCEPKALNVLSPQLMRELTVFPFKLENSILHVATIPGFSEKRHVEKISGFQISLYIASPSSLRKAMSELGRRDVNGSFDQPDESGVGFFSDDDNLTLQKLSDSSDSIIQLINQLIFQAIGEKASDIHFEPLENGILVKFRIDGVLFPIRTIDKKSQQALSGRVKIISELDTTQKRTPQDGRFKLRVNGRRIDFRVSIIPSIFGESIVIRILDKLILDLDLENLGFSKRDFELFAANIRNPYGMVLVSGPTGSGKTTTLYSAITKIKTSEIEVITIEDPVEYIIPGIIQIAVNDRQGLTFSTGLRSIVRHDPDIIMVGEIRDSETAQIAVQASLTGHLVFSTIHCNNTVDVISRFANMKIETYEFASAVNLLIAQRLVRRICSECRVKESSGEGKFRGLGCQLCKGRGYQGRTGIFEVLPMCESIKTMVLEKATPFAIMEEARKQGVTTLREAGIEKMSQGITTLDEVNAVTMDPQSFGKR